MITAGPAEAQGIDDLPPVPIAIPDRVARELPDFVRQVMPGRPKYDGGSWGPETAEELSRPIIPPDLEAAVIRRGSLSALLKQCGIDPDQASFPPLMRAVRDRGGLNERQIGYVGMLHGATQRVMESEVSATSCTESNAKALAAEVVRNPWPKR